MSASLLKHTDDDGDLSVFASGDELLFACSRGHYWTVRAPQASVTDDEPSMDRLADTYGPALHRALGVTTPPER